MKPSSSRSQSSEIFLICIGFIAPKSIDAKLFDPNFVFKEVEDPGLKRPDVLHKKYEESYKRQRSGYDDSLGMTLRASMKVSEFIHSKDPVRVLTDINEIKFVDDDDKIYLEHPRTTEEVNIALSDLKVLGKIDFKKLLKWRQLMRDTYHPAPEKPEGEKVDEPEEELDPEEKIMQEIDDMRYKVAVEEKKAEKKSRKELRKERLRQQLGMHHNAFDVSEDQELFGLDGNITAEDMDRLADVELDDDENQDLFSDDEEKNDDDENDKKFVEILDHDLEDELEEDYKRNMLQKRSKKAQRIGADALEEREFKSDRTKSNKELARKNSSEQKLHDLEKNDEDLLNSIQVSDEEDNSSDNSEESMYDDEDSEVETKKKVHFMVSKGTSDAVTGKAGKWFANPLFSTSQSVLGSVSAALQEGEKERIKSSNKRKREEEDEEDEDKFNFMPKTDKELRKEKRRKTLERKERKLQRQQKKAGTVDDDEDDEHRILGNKMDDEGFRIVPSDAVAGAFTQSSASNEDDSRFEVVPQSFRVKRKVGSDDEDSDSDGDDDGSMDEDDSPQRHDDRMYDSDNEDYDRHDRLMTKAIGTMIVSHPSREKALVDASYNRFAFNDAAGLPSWFLDDEMRHNKPSIPVPQALLEQIKNKFQMTGTNGKVIKKVAEARMRKKKRALMQLKKAKKQASLLAENNELSERQKVKMISKAMRGKTSDKEKDKKIYVATRKTQAGSSGSMAKGGAKGGKLKFVDKRLKKDKRAQRNAEKRKKGKR
jgi:AdoMet-dependent rRNA methyltransferase SPB1